MRGFLSFSNRKKSASAVAIGAAVTAAWMAGSPLKTYATDNWINAGGGVWSDGNNWSDGQSPAAGEGAVNTITAATITNDTTSNPSSFTTTGAFIMPVGTITGSAAASPFTVGGLLTWNGGMFTSLAVAANGGISFGPGNEFLSTGTLTNPVGQTATLGASGGSNLYMDTGSTFTNAGTFNAIAGSIDWYTSTSVTFNNTGSFNVTGASNNAVVIAANVDFINSGTTEVKTGTLSLNGGGSSAGGMFLADGGATLDFTTGTYNVPTAGMSIGGAGAVTVSDGGVLSALAKHTITVTSSALALNGGTITGAGSLTDSGVFTWNTGLISIANTSANGGVVLGAGNDFLSTGIFTNAAGQTATLGASGAANLYMDTAATFVNAGTFNATAGSINYYFGANSTFNNSGTFNVTGASNSPVVVSSDIDFINIGTVEVKTGTLSLNGGGSSAGGTFLADGGATLDFTTGIYNVPAGGMSIGGAGAVTVSGGTLSAAAGNKITVTSSALQLNGGTITGAGSLTDSGIFSWNGGYLSISSTTANGGIIFGAGNNFLSGGILTNSAGQTATLGASGASNLYMDTGATFANAGILNATSGGINYYSGAGSTFNNSGNFNVTAAVGSPVTVTSNIDLINSGTIEVKTGTLSLNGGSSSAGGTFLADSGATLDFTTGIYNVPATGMNIGGKGHVTISGGTISVPLNSKIVLSSSALQLIGGTISGAGSLTDSGVFSWSTGILSIASTIANGGISFGAGNDFLSGGTLTNSAGQTANLGGTAASNLYMDTAATFANAGTLYAFDGGIYYYTGAASTFNNSGTFNVAPAPGGVITVSTNINAINSGTISVQTGTLDIQGSLNNTGTITVQNGATLSTDVPFTSTKPINVAGNLTAPSTWNIAGGSLPQITGTGTINLNSGTTTLTPNGGTSQMKALNLNGGILDITNNTLLINYGSASSDPVTTIRNQLSAAYASKYATGTSSITSSIAAAKPAAYAIGYIDNTTTKQLEIALTVPGDTNLSGSTDFNDLTTVAQFFGQSTAKGNNVSWSTGDVDFDNQVDFNDLTLVAQYFGDSLTKTQAASLPSSFVAQYNLALAEISGGTSSVPEPGTISLLAVGAAGLLARRLRRR